MAGIWDKLRALPSDNNTSSVTVEDVSESKVTVNQVGGNMERAGRDIVHGNVTVNNIFQGLNGDEAEHQRHYLRNVLKDCAALEWLEQVRQKDDNGVQIRLDTVYTALLTTSTIHGKAFYEGEKSIYSAVEMLNEESMLVITGAPGSGKSALVNFVALCMAGQILEDGHCNLDLLTRPLPDENGKQQEDKQSWQHPALIPLRVILRDFAASPFFPTDHKNAGARALQDFIEEHLKDKTCEDYFAILKGRLRQGKVLVMFDGLDEVPEAGEKRERMKRCIEDFCASYADNRFLVTVRPYAYQEQAWKLAGFSETELAKFDKGQIALFINGWYRDCPELGAEVAQKRAQQLKNAIFNLTSLKELAERPLLLTLIAFLHRNRHELPDRRADLYEKLLELLIEKWEKARFKVKDADEALQLEQQSLAEYLQVGFESIRKVLERLAFAAHARQADSDKGTADIAAKDLSHEMLCLAKNKGITINNMDDYLRDRVGILYQRGGDSYENAVYSFPHRSFQEYLAASYFSRGEKAMYEEYAPVKNRRMKWYELAAMLGRGEPDRWREVVVLAGAIHADDEQMAELINALIDGIDEDTALSVQQNWGLRLAGEILAENIDRNSESSELAYCREDLQGLLPKLLQAATLTAVERVTAGRHLAKIGDIRPEVMDVDRMQFCLIPAGEFYLGSDDSDKYAEDDEKQNAGLLNLDYAYAMARFPVTVAQYRQFVEASGHQMKDSRCLQGWSNAPVVYVTWHEAIKFCDWLTERWRSQGLLPEGWRVDLPSEPEWEKAARGGVLVPVAAKIFSIDDDWMGQWQDERPLKNNDEPKRFYPWGNALDDERCNYEGRVGGVSTMDCYPSGSSPYGCEDMAGNVLEWTRTAYEKVYPSQPAEWERLNTRDEAVGRVLRGGAFFASVFNVRCSRRAGRSPDYRYDGLGVRLVLSPYL